MDGHNPKCRPARYMSFDNGNKVIQVDQSREKMNQQEKEKKEKQEKEKKEKEEKEKQKVDVERQPFVQYVKR